MGITEILGYFGALAIGVVLGLIGGGGSILTVPVLVYLFYINPVVATAYSLFVVGISSLVGALQNIQKGLVDYRTYCHYFFHSSFYRRLRYPEVFGTRHSRYPFYGWKFFGNEGCRNHGLLRHHHVACLLFHDFGEMQKLR